MKNGNNITKLLFLIKLLVEMLILSQNTIKKQFKKRNELKFRIVTRMIQIHFKATLTSIK